LTAAERLTRARAALVLDAPFFGALALRLQFKPDPSVETAAVDGRTLYYSPSFVKSLTDPQLRGILAHEVLHCAAGHCWRRGDRDFARWNLACDRAINHHVIAAGFTLPEDAIPGEDGSAEEFYGRMRTEPQQGEEAGQQADQADQQQDQPDDNQQDEDQNQPEDEPDDQDSQEDQQEDDQKNQSEQDSQQDDSSGEDEGQDSQEDQQEDGQGDGTGDDSQQDSEQADGGDSQSDQNPQSNSPTSGQSGKSVQDPGGCGGVMDAPEDDQGNSQEEWQVATVQAAMAAKAYGDMPGIAARLLDEYTRPKVDWRVVLADFVQRTARNDYDWAHPNRRHLQRGFLLPGLRSNELPEVVVAVDTSGSIDAPTLAMFAGAVSDVLAAYPTMVHVLAVDAAVQSAAEYRTEDLPIKLDNLPGGGGTDFCPAFEWVDKQQITPSCLIYLTDLYGSFPEREPDYPVLWVCTTDQRAPFGETLNLPQSSS